MGNISTVLGCDNQADILKAKQIELEEALERAELYKNEVERVKLKYYEATGRPVESSILKTSESFRISTNLKDNKVVIKSISFSVDNANARSSSYGDLNAATREELNASNGKDGGNISNSLRRLFRPLSSKKDRNPTPPPIPSPSDGKFTHANGN